MTLAPTQFCLPNGVSAAQFLSEYWQKKPALIRGGMPSLANHLQPDDVLQLATFDDVDARLITQDDANPNNWRVDYPPFCLADFASTPRLWTLLVQDCEQWSFEIAEHWQAFGFLPQWLRDDIMVSYAPAGGSVGMHYDRYDVFLVQGYGSRRWQLGKFCNEKTPILPNQPLRLLHDMGDIVFDDVLYEGDVLYVPPFLSHYGVAQSDCLTYSFGLRSPTNLQLADALLSQMAPQKFWQAPCTETLGCGLFSSQHGETQQTQLSQAPEQSQITDDQTRGQSQTTDNQTHAQGKIETTHIELIKSKLIDAITQLDDTVFATAVATTLSQRRFHFAKEDEVMEMDNLLEALSEGAVILKEPAVKLLYTLNSSKQQDPLELYCQGEHLAALYPSQKWLLKKLADGDRLGIEDLEGFDMDALCSWANQGWITLKH